MIPVWIRTVTFRNALWEQYLAESASVSESLHPTMDDTAPSYTSQCSVQTHNLCSKGILAVQSSPLAARELSMGFLKHFQRSSCACSGLWCSIPFFTNEQH